jgi:hypothetical protein
MKAVKKKEYPMWVMNRMAIRLNIRKAEWFWCLKWCMKIRVLRMEEVESRPV